MTKKEGVCFNNCWLEVENLITLIFPNWQPEKQIKRPKKAGPKEILSLLQLLRVLVKVQLHDLESTRRENKTLVKLSEEQKHD